jgi:hypothetical protein
MASLAARWHALYRLPRTERTLLFQAVVLLPVLALDLRWRGFRRAADTAASCARLWRTVRRDTVLSGDADDRLPEVCGQAVQAVDRATRWLPWPPSCLARSLALWCLLACCGVRCELRMGARRTARRLEAHAWVEYRGVVLNDTPDVHEHFVTLEPAARHT